MLSILGNDHQLVPLFKQIMKTKLFGGIGPIEAWYQYFNICNKNNIIVPFNNFQPKYREEDLNIYRKYS